MTKVRNTDRMINVGKVTTDVGGELCEKETYFILRKVDDVAELLEIIMSDKMTNSEGVW